MGDFFAAKRAMVNELSMSLVWVMLPEELRDRRDMAAIPY